MMFLYVGIEVDGAGPWVIDQKGGLHMRSMNLAPSLVRKSICSSSHNVEMKSGKKNTGNNPN
jgi:hypothetical protein